MSNEKWSGSSTEFNKVKNIKRDGTLSGRTRSVEDVDDGIDVSRHVNTADYSKLVIEFTVHDTLFQVTYMLAGWIVEGFHKYWNNACYENDNNCHERENILRYNLHA